MDVYVYLDVVLDVVANAIVCLDDAVQAHDSDYVSVYD